MKKEPKPKIKKEPKTFKPTAPQEKKSAYLVALYTAGKRYEVQVQTLEEAFEDLEKLNPELYKGIGRLEVTSLKTGKTVEKGFRMHEVPKLLGKADSASVEILRTVTKKFFEMML